MHSIVFVDLRIYKATKAPQLFTAVKHRGELLAAIRDADTNFCVAR